MVTLAENELLTRTGPGTPMGETLRRYWVPALLAEELPTADGPPVRVRLLGEDLIAFRATDGRVGLLGDHCAHRGASLFFGRNEENGLRCVYHGWKYDVSGQCVDMLNEPPESSFKHRVRQTAYPCVEAGGLICAYLGPPDRRPALPELEWVRVPPAQRVLSKRLQDCNWLQAVEGGVDLSHISILHRELDQRRGGRDLQRSVQDAAPRTETLETPAGLLIAARRTAEPGHAYWRINQFLLPWYTMFPPLVDTGIGGHAWVPVDDEHCWAYSVNWHPTEPLALQADGRTADGVHADLVPGSYRPLAHRDNDYLLDRTVQRTRTFTGIPGFAAQDCAVQESMGAIYDRTQERLVASDVPIVAVRRRLLEAVRAVQAGQPPPGLDAAAYRVRPAALVLPDGVPFAAGARHALIAGASQPLVKT